MPVCLIAALLTHNHCRGAWLTHAVQDRCLADSALTDPGTAFSLAAARFTTHVTGVSGARQPDEMRRHDRRAQETKDQDSKKLQRRVRGRKSKNTQRKPLQFRSSRTSLPTGQRNPPLIVFSAWAWPIPFASSLFLSPSFLLSSLLLSPGHSVCYLLAVFTAVVRFW